MPKAEIWKANAAAIVRIRDHATGDIIALHHPTYPYEATWGDDDPATLEAIAAAYLARVQGVFGFGELFADPKTPRKFRPDVPLAWLPLARRDVPRPLESLWIARREGADAKGAVLDRTAVLLALQSATANEEKEALGSRHGIRIVAHVSVEAQPPRSVRITTSSSSPGLRAVLKDLVEKKGYDAPVKAFFDNVFRVGGLAPELKEALRAAMGSEVWVDGIRVIGTSNDRAIVDVFGYVSRRSPDAPPLAVTARVSAAVDGAGTLDVEVGDVERTPLVAYASLNASLFVQAPACEAGLGQIREARPNRSPIELNAFRHPVALPGLTLGADVALHDDLDQVKVMQSKLVDRTADETAAERIPLPLNVPHARMNRFAALSAYQNARGLFDTLRSYGLAPADFFSQATLPVHVRYRAPMQHGPGRDGRIVNAEVDFDPPESDLIGSVTPPAGSLKPLQVKFGLADLARSESRRQPLGLAADPRWSWHEYCHLLLAASTGALELPFTHSAGDALAAILGDPSSKFTEAPRFGVRWVRGLTFPWVYLNRRHDRSVFEGWSWAGSYHRQYRFPSGGDTALRKGYWSEQILSTTLFRLYRSLGGDTVNPATGLPDPVARQAAASYTAYLILRTIRELGTHAAVPPLSPHDLMEALVDADIATQPASSGPLKGRVGGCAHKVVAWAFEAQGLDESVLPIDVVDAPGKPPAVDVFIDDGRPDAEGTFTRGGYMPVSLAWKPKGTTPPPEWQSPVTITVSGGNVTVRVRNRGSVDAANVRVRVRWAFWADAEPEPPKWNQPLRWCPLLPAQSGTKTVRAWPHPGEDFGPFGTIPAGLFALIPGRFLILAEARCPADRSNIANTGLPCFTKETPVIDLVAGDNNLGLVEWVP